MRLNGKQAGLNSSATSCDNSVLAARQFCLPVQPHHLALLFCHASSLCLIGFPILSACCVKHTLSRCSPLGHSLERCFQSHFFLPQKLQFTLINNSRYSVMRCSKHNGKTPKESPSSFLLLAFFVIPTPISSSHQSSLALFLLLFPLHSTPPCPSSQQSSLALFLLLLPFHSTPSCPDASQQMHMVS